MLLLGLIGSIVLLPASLDWAKYVRPYGPIAVGCLIALALHRREFYDRLRPLGKRPGWFLALAFGVILIDGYPSSVLVALACGMALLSLIMAPARDAISTRFMESPVVRFVGQRAYEVYLLHQAVLNAIRPRLAAIHEPVKGPVLAVLGLASTVFVASIVHHFIGQPLTQWGRRIAARDVRAPYAHRTVEIA